MSTVHLEGDTRTPVQHATYQADVRHALGEVVGPNLLGERLTVIEATYDETTGKTRLGFAYTTTHDLEPMIAAQRDINRMLHRLEQAGVRVGGDDK